MPVFTPEQLRRAVRFPDSDPDTDREITRVERTLAVRFPDTYRSILAIGGEAHMGPVRLPACEDLHFDFLTMERERFEYVSVTISYAYERLLKSKADMTRIIPFGAVGNGDHVCFDYRRDSDPRIVLWIHERAFSTSDPLVSVAESFDRLVEVALQNG